MRGLGGGEGWGVNGTNEVGSTSCWPNGVSEGVGWHGKSQ